MSIINVNTFQDHINDKDFLTNYTDVYVKQALSNLGQRSGIKGDSIVNEEFKITDITTSAVSKYICASYTKDSDDNEAVSFYIDSLDENLICTINGDSTITYSDNITPVEYCGTCVKFNNGAISKLNDEDKYYFVFYGYDNIEDEDPVYVFSVLVKEDGTLVDGIIYDTLNKVAYKNSTRVEKPLLDADISAVYYVLSSNYDNSGNLDKVWTKLGGVEASSTSAIFGEFKYYDTILYKYVKDVYNTEKYMSSDGSLMGLKRQVLYQLVKSIHSLSNCECNHYYVFFDKDLKFYYTANDSSNAIYASYDITASYKQHSTIINSTTNEVNYDTVIKGKNYIVAEGDLDKNAAFNFTVTYIDDEYVDTISAREAYLLPYVNGDKYWVINGETTTIRAIGEDAGNPNIIVEVVAAQKNTSTDVWEQNPMIIHGIGLDNPTFTKYVTFNYQLHVNNSTDLKTYVFQNIKMPTIDVSNEDQVALFENALIIVAVDIRLNTELAQILYDESLGTQAYVTFLCHVKKTTSGNYNYIALQKYPNESSNNISLDLGGLMSIENIIKFFVNNDYEPDKYQHSWLVFDGISNALKNSEIENGDSQTIYPVIEAKTTTDDNDNLNIKPFFTSSIEDSGSGITNVGNPTELFTITNTQFAKVIQDTTRTTNYIPSKNTSSSVTDAYPYFNLTDVIVRNSTTLNKINIISSDNNSKGYYGYFGADNDDVLHIGTATGNKYIDQSIYDSKVANGSSSDYENAFNTYSRLDIDLPLSKKKGESAYKLEDETVQTVCGSYFILQPDRTVITETVKNIPQTSYMQQLSLSYFTVNIKNLLNSYEISLKVPDALNILTLSIQGNDNVSDGTPCDTPNPILIVADNNDTVIIAKELYSSNSYLSQIDFINNINE